jgi:thiol-disulfide isomerase/thioredoxin
MFMILDGATLKRILISMPAVLALWVVLAFLQAQLRTPNRAEFVAVPSLPPATLVPTPGAAVTFVAPTPRVTLAAPANPAPYPIYGPAVEVRNDVWLNTDAPLRLADLRGRVVLLSFWAFECAPCVPVLANVRGWYGEYEAEGLSVIGVHFPKIEAEHSYDALAAALTRLDIPYPVAQDNDGLTWNAYGLNVWPTLALIDRRGNLRYEQIGTAGTVDTEKAIRALLAEGT